MNKIKAMLACGSVGFLGVASAFAQDGGGAYQMNTQGASDAVAALQTGITGLINDTITPAVVVIILAFAGLWGVKLVWRQIRGNRS